jgi:hypothetical protein
MITPFAAGMIRSWTRHDGSHELKQAAGERAVDWVEPAWSSAPAPQHRDPRDPALAAHPIR